MIVRMCIVGVLVTALGWADANVSRKDRQNSEILEMMKSELSKALPKKIDAYTTLIGIEVEQQTLVYVYTINTGVKSDESVRREDMPRMRKTIIRGECRRSKIHFENGMNIEYRYRNATTQTELFRIHISMKNCQQFY